MIAFLCRIASGLLNLAEFLWKAFLFLWRACNVLSWIVADIFTVVFAVKILITTNPHNSFRQDPLIEWVALGVLFILVRMQFPRKKV